MNWIDALVAAVVVLSVAWGIWRGLVREVLSILGWVVAFLSAGLFAGPVAARIEAQIASDGVRMMVAYAFVFVLALVVVSLLAHVVVRIVRAAGLSGIDRALGSLFGLARALVVLLALALLAGLTTLPRQSSWRESLAAPWLAAAAGAFQPWLPASLGSRLRYD